MSKPAFPRSTEPSTQPGSAWIRAYSGAARPLALPAPVSPSGPTGRATDDALAAWARWHVHQRVDDGASAEYSWCQLLERIRVEILAGRDLPGIRTNLRLFPELQPPAPDFALVYNWARSLEYSGAFDQTISPPADVGARSGVSGFLRRIAGIDSPAPDLVTVNELDQFAGPMTAALNVVNDARRYRQILQPMVSWLCQRVPNAVASVAFPAPAAEADDATTAMARQILDEKSTTLASATADDHSYRIFSRSLDEEKSAQAWFRPSDADLLKGIFGDHRQKARQAAHRLMRRLRVSTNRSWDFELEEGLLDNRRLASLAVPTTVPRVFRAERRPGLLDTQVCLLVDQSGSMRGNRQLLAAQAIDLAVHVLELCGITCEVLGFTTRFVADNPLVEAWRGLGRPQRPGRLNAIRHIVYKQAWEPWKRCRPWLGLMLRKEFGRENIDGEALAWAGRRLLARRSRRSVIVVLSDGSPFDEATVSANDPVYLENHLREVIAGLERSGISLFALGTGMGVGRFYRHSETVRQPEQISEVLFARLAELLLK